MEGRSSEEEDEKEDTNTVYKNVISTLSGRIRV